ncbi:hypothetical protein [Paenibacillus sp. PL2-23]|uniref:hypothetical protein n=1 Tax=Paenibacillus sp. PL2-23 TaxID=2100729 RepID=UPI0030F9488C
MKLQKKVLLEALLVVTLVGVLVIVATILAGVIQTQHYTPDIINQYASVDHLQEEVTIVTVATWPDLNAFGIGLLLAVVLYYVVRIGIRNRKAKARGRRPPSN